jgi:uncharacterized lipoprotein YajG
MKFNRILLALSAILILVSSCSPSTSLTSAWNNPEQTNNTFEKLTVMAIFPDMHVRMTAEDALVKQLAAKGIKAFPSYDEFPLAGQTKQFIGLAKDSIMVNQLKTSFQQKIKEKGIDGLMIIKPFDVKTTQEYHQGPGFSIVAPAYGYYPVYYGNTGAINYPGAYYDYYAYAVGTVYEPGYYTTSTSYYLQTNLFNVKTNKLIWAGQTKTVDYKDLDKEADLLAHLLAIDLAQRNIVTATEEVQP